MTVDIDEGKKAEDRLRRSEAYLAEAHRLTHTGAYGVVAVHADEDFHGDKTFPRRIVYWSDENYRIGGSIQRRDFRATKQWRNGSIRTTAMRCAKSF